MKIANISFEKCLEILKCLLDNHRLSFIEINSIPEALIEDFKTFNTGNTMSLVDGKECVPYRDFKNWYNKIMYGSGIDYEIKWND